MKTPYFSLSTRLAAANKIAILDALTCRSMTRNDMVELTGMSRAAVYRYMTEMVQENVIARVSGSDNYALTGGDAATQYLALQQERSKYTSPRGLNNDAMVRRDTKSTRRVAANKLALLAALENGVMYRIDARSLLGMSASGVNKYVSDLHSARVIEVHADAESFWLATDDDQPERLAQLVEALKERAGDARATCPGNKTMLATVQKLSGVFKSAIHVMVDDVAFQPRKHAVVIQRDPLVAALFGPASI